VTGTARKTSKLKIVKVFTVVLLTLLASVCAAGQLAQTPPMGWNSWNHFGVNITDATVRAQAQAMISSGMHAVGYNYVNIDDGWQGARDAQGVLQPNSNFPDMAGLAQYVHALGLNIGIYSSPGPKTCSGHLGSFEHEQQDAQTFAAWGMDYLKYDWCSCGYDHNICGAQQPTYLKMHDALQNTGRPFFYMVSDSGEGKPWLWAASVGGQSWGTGPNVKDDYYRMAEIGFGMSGLERFSGPGHWNDPDMLEIGNGGMNDDQYRTHMSLWCLMAAPLIAGNDLTQMASDILEILANPEMIAVDQDTLGVQGRRVWQLGPEEIWTKPLADGSTAVGVFNRVQGAVWIALPFHAIGVTGQVAARDLWKHKDLGLIQDGYKVQVATYGATVLKLTPKK
jgi:alpha-galactosidase